MLLLSLLLSVVHTYMQSIRKKTLKAYRQLETERTINNESELSEETPIEMLSAALN